MSYDDKVSELLGLAVSPPAQKRIEQAAEDSQFTLRQYVGQILEQHAAELMVVDLFTKGGGIEYKEEQ